MKFRVGGIMDHYYIVSVVQKPLLYKTDFEGSYYEVHNPKSLL